MPLTTCYFGTFLLALLKKQIEEQIEANVYSDHDSHLNFFKIKSTLLCISDIKQKTGGFTKILIIFTDQ